MVSNAQRTLVSVIEGFWSPLFLLCVFPLFWMDWDGFSAQRKRSNSHPSFLTHLCLSHTSAISHSSLFLHFPPFLLPSHVSSSFLHSCPLLPFCQHTVIFQYLSLALLHFLLASLFLGLSVLPWVFFYPLSLLSRFPSHTITASAYLPLSFRHISLGAIQPANTFYGLNPFSHCVFTGLGAGIDLPLFVSPITRFLSRLPLFCFFLVAPVMAHHILPFSPFSLTCLTLFFFHLTFSFLISALVIVSLFVLFKRMFSSTYTSSSLWFFLLISPPLT